MFFFIFKNFIFYFYPPTKKIFINPLSTEGEPFKNWILHVRGGYYCHPRVKNYQISIIQISGKKLESMFMKIVRANVKNVRFL